MLVRRFLVLICLMALFCAPLQALPASTLYGRVTDPLGMAVSAAHILLFYEGKLAATAVSAADGTFTFLSLASGRFQVQVQAAGFTLQNSNPIYISTNTVAGIEIAVQIAPLQQEIVVSATGSAMPESQVGAAIGVLNEGQLRDEDKVDLLESLREIPGVQVVQTGQRGGTTALFVRGGDSSFNKVLIDGVPANDIGGAFDFGTLADTGVGKVEVMRGADSVLYGTDAMGGTIRISSPRGSSAIPEFRYFADAGNFHTAKQTTSLAGARSRLDYLGAFSRFDTQNSLPNNTFHNETFSGNAGFGLTTATTLRLTARKTSTNLGLPGPYDFYGIADDSSQMETDTYAGLTLQNQTTASWHNQIRAGGNQRRYDFVNPSPTGTPSDPFGFGANYIGQPVTIRGANGYSATGQAILDYGGTYPQTFDAFTKRRSLYAQSDYRFSGSLSVSGGFRYEHESGWTDSGIRSQTVRDNRSYFLEAQGVLHHRFYFNGGGGLEDNAVFRTAATPRVSLAYYFRPSDSRSLLGSTRLAANFGTGIEEPSILNQGSSLYALLSPAAQGQALISKFGIAAIGPERSKTFDTGVEQGLWRERLRIRGAFFDNRFYDLVEFVDKSALPLLGISTDVAAASGFGAAINSGAYRAKGAEIEGSLNLNSSFRIQGNFTYLDAVVTKSFSSSALGPSFNPAFPAIPIGAFSPLVGGRPFRRSPDEASLSATYSAKQWGATLNGYFTGRSDDSTYLSDQFSGTSLLLPNRNLNPAFQKVDVSGHYASGRYSVFYASVENVLNRKYSFPIGYPVLPLTFRTGVQLRLGGGR